MTRVVDFRAAVAPAPSVTRVWSPQQQAVFAWFESGKGNLVVRARAGTGKTTTIVEGVGRAPERQILLAAFNKVIATELQSRVRSPRVECKTLHALGFKYVRRNWKVEVCDGDERSASLARRACDDYAGRFSAPQASDRVLRLVRDLHTKCRELVPTTSDWHDVESVAVRFNLVPDAEEEWSLQAVCMASYRAMQLARERTSIIDFADMIFLPLAHGWVRPWFDMVVVDEAQDMTEAQLAIATGACRRGGRICVVGDDRQAIYGFRGADSGSLDRLKKELRAEELGLTVTYRCASGIVELARALVPDFSAAPGAAPGEIVRRDGEDAMAEMAEGDFVVSRTNAPLVGICLQLLKRGIRARIRGRDVGRGIISLIRKLRASTVAEVPDRLSAHVDRELAAAAQIASVEAREAREEFVRDQASLVLALCEGCSAIAEVMSRCEELFSDDAGRGAVVLSTVHRVKGLEADRTFLLEQTFRPPTAQEEANIRYVAITRAKTRLCWVTS